MSSFVGNTKKILIVVDVQNCFLFNEFQRGPGDFLNSSGDEETIKMVKEIGDLYREHKKDGFTIFTRDAHPLNHSSFSSQNLDNPDPKAPWPNHCRMEYSCNDSNPNESFEDKKPKSTETIKTIFDKSSEKATNIQNIFKETYISDININYKVIGNHLSYLFNFDSDLKEVLTDLDNIQKNNTISILALLNDPKKTISDTTDMVSIHYPEPEKNYVQLLKGQRCEEDANSAFNYHIGYKTKKGFYDSLENRYSTDSSTGLWDYLLDKFPDSDFNITVCGMVGNVCVIFTVTEGILMWERVYKPTDTKTDRKVTFNFSFEGTCFVPNAVGDNINVVRPPETVFSETFGINRINNDILPSGYTFVADELSTIGTITTPNAENYTFNILPYKTAQQQGGKKYKKCPKCKKHPYHGGKCFICGFIPFLGKTTTKKRKGRRGNGKKTRKNKRRFSRRK